MQEFRFDKLESARNEAGFLGCTIGDIGTCKVLDIREILNEAAKYHFAMIEELKKALRLAREKGLDEQTEIKPEIFEDGINPDPDDWENQSKYEGL